MFPGSMDKTLTPEIQTSMFKIQSTFGLKAKTIRRDAYIDTNLPIEGYYLHTWGPMQPRSGAEALS
jgi:hypothetical protein